MARWPYPRLIAHRGGGTLAPENTLAAIRAGHAHGFKGVEFDVALSRDSVPMLMHDHTLERTTSGHGRMDEADSAVLARLDAGGWHGAAFRGEPVPSFEQAAALCLSLGMWANVEIKPTPGRETETGRLAALQARATWGVALHGGGLAPLLSSFRTESLAAARQAAPELPRALLCDAVPRDWHGQLRALDCVALHCDAERLDGALARAVADAGYGLAVWTVNDPAQAKRLFDLGVDAIFTDRLDLFQAE